MRNYFLTILLFYSSISWAQDYDEYNKYVVFTVRNNKNYKGYVIDNGDTTFDSNKAFVYYTTKYLLEKPEDSKFISNRNKLPKLKQTSCDSTKTLINGNLIAGEKVEIILKTKPFDSTKHHIYLPEDSIIFKVDGEIAYGYIDSSEIDTLIIKINNKPLNIPKTVYQNLLIPNSCDNRGGFLRQIEAYSSANGKYIYLYIYGGYAATTYFAKLIFDKERYLTRIIADYWILSLHSSFHKNFIGF